MYSLKNKPVSILVVEDNKLDALIIKTLLEPHFNIEIVTNSNDTLNIIEDIKFDFILMDINLGNDPINGIDLMKMIRQIPKYHYMKFFAVTAFSENDNYYIEQGFDAFFIKPVIKEEIFEFINNNIQNQPLSA